MAALAPERLSDLIGKIYDCAIEPDLWPDTLGLICRAIQCMSGIIVLIDLEHSLHRLAYTCGMSQHWAQRFLDFSPDLTQFYSNVFRRDLCPDGEPLILSHYIEAVGPRGQQFHSEWIEPQGVSDMMQAVVLREAHRLAVVGANRHESVGGLSESELAVMRLLVPHIRRAVKIADILDIKKIEADTLSATLDNFTA